MFLIEQIKSNITTVDRQLLLMIYEQQVETNRLLAILTSGKEQTEELSDSHIEAPHKRRGRPRTA